MSTLEMLVARRVEVRRALEKSESLKVELHDLDLAIAALEPKVTCRGCLEGCDECRPGMRYR